MDRRPAPAKLRQSIRIVLAQALFHALGVRVLVRMLLQHQRLPVVRVRHGDAQVRPAPIQRDVSPRAPTHLLPTRAWFGRTRRNASDATGGSTKSECHRRRHLPSDGTKDWIYIR